MDSAAGLTAAGLKGLHAAAEGHVGDDRVPGLVTLVACGGQVHPREVDSPLIPVDEATARGIVDQEQSRAVEQPGLILRGTGRTRPLLSRRGAAADGFSSRPLP